MKQTRAASHRTTLYRVHLERNQEAVFYIEADSLEAAKEDADHLACELSDEEWDGFDPHIDVSPAAGIGKGDAETFVWVGGEKGTAVRASAWRPS